MNCLVIAGTCRTPFRSRRLTIAALLGLLLWVGLVASLHAQTIAPTSPCNPAPAVAPPGWTIGAGSADCSNVSAWAGTAQPWALGNVPATPGGDSTFVTLISAPDPDSGTVYFESIGTTITGLVAGDSYTVNMFVNGNPFSSGASACPGAVIINGVTSSFAAASGNTWAQRSVRFVAGGTTASLQVQSSPAGTYCVVNVYLGADAVVPDGTDLRMVKTVSPTGPVAAGGVLTYTLTAKNAGPKNTTNARLQDVPAAGLDCTTPSPTATCTASGGASCPGATVPISNLTGAGLTIPSLPVNGQVVLTMQCKVTATGS